MSEHFENQLKCDIKTKQIRKAKAEKASKLKNFISNFIDYLKIVAKLNPLYHLDISIGVFEQLMLEKTNVLSIRTIEQQVLDNNDDHYLDDQILRDIVTACKIMLYCQEVRKKCHDLDAAEYMKSVNKIMNLFDRSFQQKNRIVQHSPVVNSAFSRDFNNDDEDRYFYFHELQFDYEKQEEPPQEYQLIIDVHHCEALQNTTYQQNQLIEKNAGLDDSNYYE